MKRSFAEIKMNLLFHSLVFTSHLEQVLRTPLQKCLNNESRRWQPEHGGRWLHAHQHPRTACHAASPHAGSSPWPLLSRHVSPHGSRSRAGAPGEVFAPLPGSNALAQAMCHQPHQCSSLRVPSPANVRTMGLPSSPPRAAMPGETMRPGGHELMARRWYIFLYFELMQ